MYIFSTEPDKERVLMLKALATYGSRGKAVATNMQIFTPLNRVGFWTIPRPLWAVQLPKGKEILLFLGRISEGLKTWWDREGRKMLSSMTLETPASWGCLRRVCCGSSS